MDEERLIVSLEARINDFEKRMKKAERTGTRSYQGLRRGSASATRQMEADMNRATTRINQALASTTARIGSFSRAFAGGAVLGVVTGALASVNMNIGETIKGIATLGDEAKRAGVSATAFQEWKFVAEQNRIGIDSMVDGLKELNLRADEFIVTGKGPAAEAFRRLNYDAADLARGLDDPSELLLEIVDRLGDLDSAAQIRVADEVFGGTAGERFVELIGQGEEGLRRTIERAHEVGAVMDDEMIRKAAELDRKWGELQTRVGSFFKSLAVGSVEFASQVSNMREELDGLFRSYEQAEGLLGTGIAENLDDETLAADENAEAVGRIRQAYEGLADQTGALVPQLEQASMQMRSFGYTEAADELANIAAEMRTLSSDMRDGTVDAETFETRMTALTEGANAAFNELSAIDKVEFSGAIAAVGGLIGRLAQAVTQARALRAALPGGTPDGTTTPPNAGRGGDPRSMGGSFGDWKLATATENAPTSVTRPSERPPMLAELQWWSPPGSGGGGSSGGGSSKAPKLSELEQEIKSTREEIAQLQAEAVELAAVADSGMAVGDAMEYARKRAELLYAAQASGKEITPELRAEIDQLALGYTQAGKAAEDAADRLDLIQQHAERGADKMTDLFTGIVSGSMSAKDALAGLLMELGRVQIQKAMLGLADSPSGGFLGTLGAALTARATGGPVQGGTPYLVNERTPNSEIFVPSQSGGILNVPQAQAALRGAVSSQPQKPQPVELILHAAEGITVETVRNEASAIMRQGIGAYDRQMPARVKGIQKDPRAR
ncbi:hypothetical protein [Limimaricola hongkongensis]|nr:hypothetical protein [Limimaricola hongkongensis]